MHSGRAVREMLEDRFVYGTHMNSRVLAERGEQSKETREAYRNLPLLGVPNRQTSLNVMFKRTESGSCFGDTSIFGLNSPRTTGKVLERSRHRMLWSVTWMLRPTVDEIDD